MAIFSISKQNYKLSKQDKKGKTKSGIMSCGPKGQINQSSDWIGFSPAAHKPAKGDPLDFRVLNGVRMMTGEATDSVR